MAIASAFNAAASKEFNLIPVGFIPRIIAHVLAFSISFIINRLPQLLWCYGAGV